MNKKGNKIILAIVCLLFILIGIIFIFANKDREDEINDLQEEEFIRLNNVDTFFGIQNVISNYNKDYLFTAEKIIYNKNSDIIKYYFVNGYLIANFEAREVKDNNNYLVIVKNNKYVIKELGNINNIEEYAKNYKLENVDISSGKVFKESTLSEETVLRSYLTKFRNMLSIDAKKSYSFLGDKMLTKYPTYNSFANDIPNIIRNLNIDIFGYSKVTEEDSTIYKIQNNDFKNIEIIEYYPNDFKINF